MKYLSTHFYPRMMNPDPTQIHGVEIPIQRLQQLLLCPSNDLPDYSVRKTYSILIWYFSTGLPILLSFTLTFASFRVVVTPAKSSPILFATVALRFVPVNVRPLLVLVDLAKGEYVSVFKAFFRKPDKFKVRRGKMININLMLK